MGGVEKTTRRLLCKASRRYILIFPPIGRNGKPKKEPSFVLGSVITTTQTVYKDAGCQDGVEAFESPTQYQQGTQHNGHNIQGQDEHD